VVQVCSDNTAAAVLYRLGSKQLPGRDTPLAQEHDGEGYGQGNSSVHYAVDDHQQQASTAAGFCTSTVCDHDWLLLLQLLAHHCLRLDQYINKPWQHQVMAK
jgi:hypothetical protein